MGFLRGVPPKESLIKSSREHSGTPSTSKCIWAELFKKFVLNLCDNLFDEGFLKRTF